MPADPLDPFDNVAACVRECWKCGHGLSHEYDDLVFCPECGSAALVPFGDRFKPLPARDRYKKKEVFSGA